MALSVESQQRVIEYFRSITQNYGMFWNFREQFRIRDLEYQNELNQTYENLAAAMANRAGAANRMRDISIPIVFPQIESAVAYQSAIFLSGYPMFPVVSKPEVIDAALQMDTLMAENAIRAQWMRQLVLSIRNAFKYNISWTEADWRRKKAFKVATKIVDGRPAGNREDIIYQGNFLSSWDPYNTFFDPRVRPSEMHMNGEFIGTTELLSYVQLKKELMELATFESDHTMNFNQAYKSAYPSYNSSLQDLFYIPQINLTALSEGKQIAGANQFNWLQWGGFETAGHKGGQNYSGVYERSKFYARIIPEDFGIKGPGAKFPQVYKFYVVNRNIVVYAAPLAAAHDYIPVFGMVPNEDNLNWQTKSFGENVSGFQAVAQSLAISAIESQRRKVYDRIFYDPTRVDKKDIDNADPVARIPVRPRAYGKPIGEAVYAFPYRDDNVAGTLQLIDMVSNLADVTNGQNKVQRGQFQRGNKTRKEFDDTMMNANSRQQLMAQMLEDQFFSPLKEVLKLNVLQYQPPTELFNRNTSGIVKIDPTILRDAALEFKVTDGLLPVDRVLNSEIFNLLLQTLPAAPQLGVEYDIPGMFIYWLKTQGATWMDSFKRNEQQKAQYQQSLAGTSAALAGTPSGTANPAQQAAGAM